MEFGILLSSSCRAARVHRPIDCFFFCLSSLSHSLFHQFLVSSIGIFAPYVKQLFMSWMHDRSRLPTHTHGTHSRRLLNQRILELTNDVSISTIVKQIVSFSDICGTNQMDGFTLNTNDIGMHVTLVNARCYFFFSPQFFDKAFLSWFLCLFRTRSIQLTSVDDTRTEHQPQSNMTS